MSQYDREFLDSIDPDGATIRALRARVAELETLVESHKTSAEAWRKAALDAEAQVKTLTEERDDAKAAMYEAIDNQQKALQERDAARAERDLNEKLVEKTRAQLERETAAHLATRREADRLREALTKPEEAWARFDEVFRQNLDRKHARVAMFDLGDVLKARDAALANAPEPTPLDEPWMKEAAEIGRILTNTSEPAPDFLDWVKKAGEHWKGKDWRAELGREPAPCASCVRLRESATWPFVLSFALAMEAKLDRNRHKGDSEGWRKDAPRALFDRLEEEVRELKLALRLGRARWYETAQISDIISEAADVANFAMMLADVAALAAAPEQKPIKCAGHGTSMCRCPGIMEKR